MRGGWILFHSLSGDFHRPGQHALVGISQGDDFDGGDLGQAPEIAFPVPTGPDQTNLVLLVRGGPAQHRGKAECDRAGNGTEGKLTEKVTTGASCGVG